MTTTTAHPDTFVGICDGCNTPMTTKHAGPPPDGYKRHGGRGMCTTCYYRDWQLRRPAPHRDPRIVDRARVARTALENKRTQSIPDQCTVLVDGDGCTCYGCTMAARDTDSPFGLTGGDWVLDRVTRARKWVPNP